MAETVNVQEAKRRLSELLARVQRGEEIIIARAGVPVARLDPIAKPPARTFGTMAFHVPETFFAPLPETELEAWQ
ncbi:type II toxin-antitoxin system Phd/YefM family antitoxin [Georgenia ruanii]|uniref:Antitoxin n=1 Tax=Georgenia ruanii TaxID=348442 RepID=A0A7J9UX60_9MICO|nr:type II toxin-antitoxin system prevent-host-death family antitoxin [Georgenia ruanii]MPV89208.1 type II toxin-antitoxin system prevent-host-death family antitoxin [Georgenia ruanii]